MPSIASAFVAATLATSTLAAALPPKNNFSVHQVRKVNAPRKNGAVALAYAYQKYKVPVPEDVAKAASNILSKRSTGSAVATSLDGDSQYITPVQIGTPAQTLNLDFDTGSSDLWVFSTETTSSEVNGQTLYDPSKSSTAEKLSGATWSITYGDQSTSSGDVYTDVVSIGGAEVTGQAVESAEQVSSSFTQTSESDGLVGLAFSELNTVTPTQQKTFFDNIKSSLDSPLFTADLKHNTPGTYNFGYIDDDAHTGTIAYVDVDSSQGFWGFTSTISGSSVSGIADTGTTLLLLPDDVVSSYYSGVSDAQYDSSQGGYTFSCSDTVPDFTFTVGSNDITIPGDFINFAPVSDGSSTCFGGIQSNSGIGFSIFGDIALKAAFVVFDGGNNQLGWAPKTL